MHYGRSIQQVGRSAHSPRKLVQLHYMFTYLFCLVSKINLLQKHNLYLCIIFLLNLQMNYKLSWNNFPKPLIGNLPQRNTILCDLKIVFDHGEVWIQRTILQMWRVCWSSLLQDSSTNIVLLPGVSKMEMEENLYGEKEGHLLLSRLVSSETVRLSHVSTTTPVKNQDQLQHLPLPTPSLFSFSSISSV